jgi:hypothetical protein
MKTLERQLRHSNAERWNDANDFKLIKGNLMKKFQLLNEVLELIEQRPHAEAIKSVKFWLYPDKCYALTDGEKFYSNLEGVFNIDKKISKRFSRKLIFDFLEESLLKKKNENNKYTEDMEDVIFDSFYQVSPKTLYVTAPISGIRLDENINKFELSVFKFGDLSSLSIPISNENGIYIQTAINEVYDNSIAIKNAENSFYDFAKLIVFISGKNDKSIQINTGLPLRPSLSHEQMYVETTSYQITNEQGALEQGKIENKYLEKIPINNKFFYESKRFKKLWSMYEIKHKGNKLTDMQSRILNSSLAIGESAMSQNTKNSVIYTCIALEILFSYDEGSIFQKSIADRLADTFSYIVGEDKEARLISSNLLKKVYRMRSALVHGGDKEISDEYVAINILLKAAISELLNNEKYSQLKKIDELYAMVKDAQNSY